MYLLYEKKGVDDFAGPWVETLIADPDTGVVVAHVRGWDDPCVCDDNFEGRMAGKPIAQRGRGWRKMQEKRARRYQSWAQGIVATYAEPAPPGQSRRQMSRWKERQMKNNTMLTLDNLEEIAQRIKDMLEGKRYTFVACNEFFDFKPEVRTDQEIKPSESLSTYFDEDNTPPEFGGFHIGDTYGVWGLSTNTRDATYDSTFKNPYIVFEHRQIKMTHRAPAGHLLYWTIAIQGD